VRTTSIMVKKKKIKKCPNCNKEITQGHDCKDFKGYTSLDGKMAVPRKLDGTYHGRLIEDNTAIFLSSGMQPDGKVVNWGESIDKAITTLKKEKKNFAAGCQPNTD